MIGIYKITNRINGKCYIGQSDNIQARWQKHRTIPFNSNNRCYNYPLYRAIRKYGLNNFVFTILEECALDELEEKEMFYIKQYNAYTEGYNQNQGGPHARRHCCFDDDEVNAVIARLRNSLDSISLIAEDFGVSRSTICSINRGEHYRKATEHYPIRNYIPSRKLNAKSNQTPEELLLQNYSKRKVQMRPAKLELAQMVTEDGFERTGQHFGVSGTTIKKWCKSYQIPHIKSELVDWYYQQTQTPAPTKTKIWKRKTAMRLPVYQIDIQTGQILATFQSCKEAARVFGSPTGYHISQVCKSLRKSAYGYAWQFVERYQ